MGACVASQWEGKGRPVDPLCRGFFFQCRCKANGGEFLCSIKRGRGKENDAVMITIGQEAESGRAYD